MSPPGRPKGDYRIAHHAGTPESPRRRLVIGAGACTGAALALIGMPFPALAGAQVEEPLADAVRSALSAAVAESEPPKVSFDNIEQRLLHLQWLASMSERLKRNPSLRAEHVTRIEFLDAVWYESKRKGLQPSLVLGLIQVESGFRKYAVSAAGARGYMQVMPFWARTIGDGDASRLFHLQTNLRFGCVILRHYIDAERGDLFLALGRYNGSRGRRDYPDLVFGARQQWELTRA